MIGNIDLYTPCHLPPPTRSPRNPIHPLPIPLRSIPRRCHSTARLQSSPTPSYPPPTFLSLSLTHHSSSFPDEDERRIPAITPPATGTPKARNQPAHLSRCAQLAKGRKRKLLACYPSSIFVFVGAGGAEGGGGGWGGVEEVESVRVT